MPTKVGEFLATGRPVVVSSGLGDLNELLARYSCGVVLNGPDARSLAAAARELGDLLADPELAGRCRRLARDRFDLDDGARKLLEMYGQLSRQP
jgi:glycosyltransferase involved in cell wall biosynthesis